MKLLASRCHIGGVYKYFRVIKDFDKGFRNDKGGRTEDFKVSEISDKT